MGSTVDYRGPLEPNPNSLGHAKQSEIIHFSFRELECKSWYQDSSLSALDRWNQCKAMASDDQKVYLSVSPFITAQDEVECTIGLYESVLSDDHLKQAYLNYCKRLIEFFNPVYFNMVEDANLLYFNRADLWVDFLSFHTYLYRDLKQCYPDLVIFTSVCTSPLMEGMIKENDFVLQRLAVLQILDHSDLYALSFNLDEINSMTDASLKIAFEKLSTLSSKPLALSVEEPSATFDLDRISVNGLNTLLASCMTRNTEFVVNSSNLARINNVQAIILANANETWKKYVSLNRLQDVELE